MLDSEPDDDSSSDDDREDRDEDIMDAVADSEDPILATPLAPKTLGDASPLGKPVVEHAYQHHQSTHTGAFTGPSDWLGQGQGQSSRSFLAFRRGSFRHVRPKRGWSSASGGSGDSAMVSPSPGPASPAAATPTGGANNNSFATASTTGSATAAAGGVAGGAGCGGPAGADLLSTASFPSSGPFGSALASRRESLTIGTHALHLSSGGESDDGGGGGGGNMAPSTTPREKRGVIRRVVTRRGNLLVKQKLSKFSYFFSSPFILPPSNRSFFFPLSIFLPFFPLQVDIFISDS
jgi:hypothetical protein